MCEKDYIWNPASCSCENGKCLASIIYISVVTCDEIIDPDVESKSYGKPKVVIRKNFNEK